MTGNYFNVPNCIVPQILENKKFTKSIQKLVYVSCRYKIHTKTKTVLERSLKF